MYMYLFKQDKRAEDEETEKAGAVSAIAKKQQARMDYLEHENLELV